jgi:hypothetical protein
MEATMRKAENGRPRVSPEELETRKAIMRRLMSAAMLEGWDSQGTVASKIGVDHRSFSSWCAGAIMPAEPMLRFIELTGVSTRWLLHGTEPMYDRAPAIRLRPAESA